MSQIYFMLCQSVVSTNTINIQDTVIKIVITIIGGVAGIIVTHLFYKSKLKKEQEVRFKNLIGDQIINSLIEIRDVELMSMPIEIYKVETVLKEKESRIDLDGGETFYLSIFNNSESYDKFFDKISYVRKNYEKNVDAKTALYLTFIEKYLYKLKIYMSEVGNEKVMPVLGTIFSADIMNWRISFDKHLIKRINSYSCNLEQHYGRKWNRYRKKILEIPMKKSLLNLLITGTPVDKKGRIALPTLDTLIRNIKDNPGNYYNYVE